MEENKETKEEKLFNYTVRGTHKGEETNVSISDDFVNGAKKVLSAMFDMIFGGDGNNANKSDTEQS